MRGATPPLPNTSSWRGAQFSTGATLPFTITFTEFIFKFEDKISCKSPILL
jgi:hypothetical protein